MYDKMPPIMKKTIQDLPEFPNQEDVTVDHNHLIMEACNLEGISSSECSAYYLMTWYYNRPGMISRIGNRLVLDAEGAQGGHLFRGPIGEGDLKPALEQMMHHLVTDFKEEKVLHYLPGTFADKIIEIMPPKKVEEHVDYFDYIYDRQELAELAGKKFMKQRNSVNKFEREFNPKIIQLKPGDTESVMRCIDRWYELYGTDDHFLDMERDSVEIGLRNLWKLGGMGLRISLENEMCGLTWAVPVNKDTWMVVVEKAPREIRGVYQYVNWALANALPPEVKFLNRESDMGIEGLRTAKQRYNPVGYERKVTLYY